MLARALYGYQAGRSDELSFAAGDELTIAPQQLQPQLPGWILAGMNRQSGLVPANYLEFTQPPARAASGEAGHRPQVERKEGPGKHTIEEENSLTD